MQRSVPNSSNSAVLAAPSNTSCPLYMRMCLVKPDGQLFSCPEALKTGKKTFEVKNLTDHNDMNRHLKTLFHP